jgi:spoIIIJ-associated protein
MSEEFLKPESNENEQNSSETLEVGLEAESEESTPQKPQTKSVEHLEEEGDVGADYLEGLLDIADLDGDIEIDVVNNRATLSIEGGNLANLIGERGEVLDALQELTRLAVQTSLGERSRLMLDIDGFRENRRQELIALTQAAVEEVKESKNALKLKPMNAFERKIVHDTIQELGLTSESEGEEPNRAVVILPA